MFQIIKNGEKYYDDLLSQRLSDIKNTKVTKQPDDFLASNDTTSVPKETFSESLKVKLVSPVKQINDQVTSELRRDSESDSMKTSASNNKTNKRMKRGTKESDKKEKEK